jgi:NTE family protein
MVVANASLPEGAPSTAAAKIAVVLAGGAARGAYEVGVLDHIVEQVSKDLGFDVPLDILSGTSVGAINVCCLAGWADEPRGRVARLVSVWTNLRISEMVRPAASGVFDALRGLLGRTVPIGEANALFDAAPLAQLIRQTVPFERIDKHLRSGRIHAVTCSTTQIATGRTVVFVQRRDNHAPLWQPTSNVMPRAVRLRLAHALASAAVPALFPAVSIDGRYYCDGGLRQNIPLSPARRLGAEGLVVVNPKYRGRPGSEPELERARETTFPSPLFLLGKSLNALMLDRIDNDIDRLEKINEILDAGTRRFGAGFTDALNEELGYAAGRGLARLSVVHIRASENIGEISADYVRSPAFHLPGLLGRVMKRLAEGGPVREADLLSYLLLDGEFAGRLIELGRADARAHHEELCALFESLRVKSRCELPETAESGRAGARR